MKHVFITLLMLVLCTGFQQLSAQTYTPVALTGFNNDVVADTGTNAMAVTSTDLDLSFYILYSAAFATTNGLSGGMVNNGTIVNGTRTYQLAPYNGNNGLFLSLNGAVPNSAASGTLAVTTPAAFNKISLLLFSTEGDSKLGITLHFTDGTTAQGGSVTVQDWFTGTNAMYNGFGRIARAAAPPYTVDGLSGTNPRFYKYDIPMACSNQPKLLDSVTINFISGGTTFPSRAVVLALSGVVYTPITVTDSITPATCSNANGSIALSASGGTAPLSYAWTSSPVQVQATATDLPPGNYSCTILDANGCATTYQGTVPSQTAATLTAAANPDPLCAGSNATLTASASGGAVTNYTWQPGNGSGPNITITPAATTTYTVSALDTLGCLVSATVKVTVTPIPVTPVADAVTVCPDSTATLTVQNAVTAYTYRWYTNAAGGSPSGTGTTYVIPAAGAGGSFYYVEAVNGSCSSERTPVAVTWLQQVETPVVTATQITPNSVTFVWQPVPGAVGYQVTVNGGAYVTPSSGTTGTSHLVTGLPLSQGVTIQVRALGAQTCQHSAPASATAKLLSQDIFIPNAFTPNNDGKNDLFKAEGNIITGQLMKIFNQWGELIYETSDLAAGWNGTYKGKPQPIGVYVYAIRLKLANGTETLRKGAVNLLRP